MPSKFSALLRAALCALLVAAPWSGAAMAAASGGKTVQEAVSRADLIRLLGRLHEDETVRADLSKLGFKGENLELATQHAANMLRDPVIAGYIADRVMAVRAGTSAPMARAQGLLWGVIDQGLGHLPLVELQYYYLVEQAVLGAMPVHICGQAVRGSLAPDRMADATARAAARLNTAGLRNYYRIQLRAAQLGATRGQLKTTPKRAARAEALIFAALSRHIAQEPDAARIMDSFANLPTVDNRRACRAGKVFIDAVLTLEGRELHEALIQLSLP
ncbi:hypothetical protein DC366_14300 [Pelagivirga sediminicola]|uniref:DUF2059 domain-containing protein n=2 Tax=Pelagivirga sediminicola TaxID=2170575 RepID=A0A2T7G4H0_9RHOB|nr:hypothetical protein DC366_14300 [Pelagivirga sediminicola]